MAFFAVAFFAVAFFAVAFLAVAFLAVAFLAVAFFAVAFFAVAFFAVAFFAGTVTPRFAISRLVSLITSFKDTSGKRQSTDASFLARTSTSTSALVRRTLRYRQPGKQVDAHRDGPASR